MKLIPPASSLTLFSVKLISVFVSPLCLMYCVTTNSPSTTAFCVVNKFWNEPLSEAICWNEPLLYGIVELPILYKFAASGIKEPLTTSILAVVNVNIFQIHD